MSHITYHYLLNGSTIDGKYLYDVNHLPNKALQEKGHQILRYELPGLHRKLSRNGDS